MNVATEPKEESRTSESWGSFGGEEMNRKQPRKVQKEQPKREKESGACAVR